MGKIVFCEDDPMIQKLVVAALRGSGHELHLASDGEEGLALIRTVRPDSSSAMSLCRGSTATSWGTH